MTVKELMKLLDSGLIQYDKLKSDSQKEAVHPLIIISLAARDMNWQICIEKDYEDVRGITVGTKEYIKANVPKKRNKVNP